jgi:hypothetical protein
LAPRAIHQQILSRIGGEHGFHAPPRLLGACASAREKCRAFLSRAL